MNIQATKKQVEEITKNNPLLHYSPNRKKRREIHQKDVFMGNGKNYSLTISGGQRYRRFVQVTPCGKSINHYILVKN